MAFPVAHFVPTPIHLFALAVQIRRTRLVRQIYTSIPSFQFSIALASRAELRVVSVPLSICEGPIFVSPSSPRSQSSCAIAQCVVPVCIVVAKSAVYAVFLACISIGNTRPCPATQRQRFPAALESGRTPVNGRPLRGAFPSKR